MEYTVVITKEPDTPWRAFVPALLNCSAEAETRDEVVELIKERVAKCHLEVLRIEVPDSEKDQRSNGAPDEKSAVSIMDFAGIFRDDPTWSKMFDDIERQRDRHLVGG